MCSASVQMSFTFFLLLFLGDVTADGIHHIKKRSNTCVLPPYPDDGQYEVAGDPSAVPGDELDYVFLNVSCTAGKGVDGNNVAICIKGEWSTTMPQCVQLCHLPAKSGTEYSCRSHGETNFRQCSEYEPSGSKVKTKCLNGFYSKAPLVLLQCVDGVWHGHAECTAECGIVAKGETGLPWHATIYRKETNSFRAICGGTIISRTVLLSAAHCFWHPLEPNLVSRAEHAVAVGKSTQGWDINEQKYTITNIKSNMYYQGDKSNYQGDIALLTLNEPIQYSSHIRPVCLDFDYDFERSQLIANNSGKISLWSDVRDPSSKLLSKDIPYIPVDDCIKMAPLDFREYITPDKICGGFTNGTVLCRGNSGGGYVFKDESRGTIRYYLRGILSTAPHNDDSDSCVNVLIAFTKVSAYKVFVNSALK